MNEWEEAPPRERWELTRADGDEVVIVLVEDEESIKVYGGDGEGYSGSHDEVVNSLIPKYEAQGYAVTYYFDYGAADEVEGDG